MEQWITSDTHFWHKNIMKYQPEDRPFKDVYEMNAALIERWNAKVQPDDEIYHLGDFGFCNANQTVEILEQLNGKKFFIFGNHDRQMREAKVREHFVWSKDYHELKMPGLKGGVVLCHYPMYSWNRMHHSVPHLYGHTHGSIPFVHSEGMARDVGCDTNNCEPYNLKTLMYEMRVHRDLHGVIDARKRYNDRD
jgi:calcineurin-like phosphoesterase family protein